jgi:hypothetical protein
LFQDVIFDIDGTRVDPHDVPFDVVRALLELLH